MARRLANIERNKRFLAAFDDDRPPPPRAAPRTGVRFRERQPSNAPPARTRSGVAADIHEMMCELVSYDNRHGL